MGKHADDYLKRQRQQKKDAKRLSQIERNKVSVKGTPRELTPGAESKSFSPEEEETRRAEVIATVEKYLPEFAKAVRASSDIMIQHQDAFAAGYHDDEYVLLGMAVKYAGLSGRDMMITGVNGETMRQD